ncbi:uncharacterized protein G2W53_024138 [Senna tora]|uniref:Reverse transcriptase domain-containing protein n=1 Tax=Senna tora TaxID=362788 RepID=A0A834TAQ3_9FABA|nr:uncharacterized protein G2W53_024138 [Senna tora]
MEIETALFQMQGGKAPGPDGMSPMFFQHCWDTVQEDITHMGIKIARGAPTINHLMYADDLLLFFKVDRSTCTQVGNLLTQFGEMAGLGMNHQKSEVKFSPNISEEGARVLTRILSCRRVDHLGKYLGSYIDGANTAKRNASLILDTFSRDFLVGNRNCFPKRLGPPSIKAVLVSFPFFICNIPGFPMQQQPMRWSYAQILLESVG